MDYSNAAELLKCEVKAVKAVAKVESSGNGFTTFQSRPVPKILFERHVFYAQLKKFKGELFARSIMKQHPDLCNTSPGGYTKNEHERLDQAALIHREAALSAASWGAFQVMGYHWERLGYSSVQDLVNKAYSEEGQLETFVLFIQSDDHLLQALRDKDWASFAYRYNGRNYKINNYDTKMAAAYNG